MAPENLQWGVQGSRAEGLMMAKVPLMAMEEQWGIKTVVGWFPGQDA